MIAATAPPLIRQVRVLLVITCGVLLAGRVSYGGPEELFALEWVRIQAAKVTAAMLKPPERICWLECDDQAL